jgi:hypothetical protein
VTLKVKLVHSNSKENFCSNACVLLRSCFNVFKNPSTPDSVFAEFSFAKGQAKVKLGEFVDGS